MNILERNFDTTLQLVDQFINDPFMFSNKRKKVQYKTLCFLLIFLERHELYEKCGQFIKAYKDYRMVSVVFSSEEEPDYMHIQRLNYLILGPGRSSENWNDLYDQEQGVRRRLFKPKF